MTKADLVEAVARKINTSKSQADAVVGAVLDGIGKGLRKDKAVRLVGFGTFIVRQRKARTGRNPRTGAEVKIKASKTVGFKAGKALKSSV